jgi:DNA polymerase-3 subunit delta
LNTKRKSARATKSSDGLPFGRFEAQLEKGVGGLYAFVGNDGFLRTECVALVCKHIPAGDLPTTPAEFDGESCRLSAVFDELKTMPLLGDWRVVAVRNASKFMESCSEHIEAWPDFPAKSVLMLLDEKLDARTRLTKDLSRKGVVVNCDEMNEGELGQWLSRRLSEAGIKASPQTISGIFSRVGRSAGRLNGAVDQLALYAGGKGAISPADIETVLSDSASEVVWTLTDAVCEKNWRRCIETASELLEQGEAVPQIMGAVSWQVLRLLKAKWAMAQGASLGDAVAGAKVKYGRERQFENQLNGFTLDELNRILAKLTETDLKLKTSSSSPEKAKDAFMDFIVGLAG